MCRRSAKRCQTPWGFTGGGDSFLLHPGVCRDLALLRLQGTSGQGQGGEAQLLLWLCAFSSSTG